jgi:hypothetical protein
VDTFHITLQAIGGQVAQAKGMVMVGSEPIPSVIVDVATEK